MACVIRGMACVTVRPGTAADLEAVARIQAASPEAVRWDPPSYLQYDFLVATDENHIAGFLVARRVAEEESEILNLAVDPACRRRGIGRRLADAMKLQHQGEVFLEVRESNANARSFYKALGFQEVSVRFKYYEDPPESAIVMKFHSC
jgi:ribosomal-protein-alanine N-acetyltransferase